jgi:uncharacterized protein (TIGR03435 family)
MTHVISGVILQLGSSLAASIVAKATLVVTLGLMGAWLARGNRAAVRHVVLAASFAVLMVLPIASILVPPVRIAVPTVQQEWTAPPLFERAIDTNQASAPTDQPAAVTSVISRWSWPSVSTLLLVGWFAGAALFLLRMIRGLRQVHSLRRLGIPWRHGESVVKRLALDAGIYRRVEMLLHESLPAPVTCGVVHPAILLPPDARNWGGENLKRAIVHELEHVRRCDWMSHCLARIVCAVYWFHPLVWMAWRRLALEAERACDDAVVGRSEATAYADQLLELAQRMSGTRKSPALAMANRSDLSSRIGAVLDRRQRRGRAGTLLVALACFAVALLLVTMSSLRMIAAPQAATLEFEVASIKPIDPNVMHNGTPRVYPGGRVVLEASSLKGLVLMAFDLSYWQLSGGEAWMEKDLYDVEAKPPANLQPAITNLRHSNFAIADERLREMLQTMLIDRFHLKFHRETKTGKVYLLERGSGALQLHPTGDGYLVTNRPDDGFSGDIGFAGGIAGGRWVIFNTSMPQLAKFAASIVLHAPVLDRTGLSGSFDYKQPTRLPDSEVNYSDPSGPFLNLIPELGLKFESSKGPVESFVIDQADKPSPN